MHKSLWILQIKTGNTISKMKSCWWAFSNNSRQQMQNGFKTVVITSVDRDDLKGD